MSFADAYNAGGGGGGGGMPGGSGGGGGGNDEMSRESKAVAGLIFQMTTNVSSFKRLVDALGTNKDTRELRAKLNKQRETIGQMAKDASVAVKRLAQTVTNSDDAGEGRSQHVAQHQKLVKDFHAVLKVGGGAVYKV
jgi:syntaxin 7